jgi:hypothetical protein
MSPNELVEDLRRRPFEPLRFYVSDGSVYDIHHPEQCMVSLTTAHVGLAANPAAHLYERIVRIDCRHIVKVEPIRNVPITGNGESPAG